MSQQSNARQRGAYGERRLLKKLGGVKVGLQKTLIIGGKTVEITADKHPDIITKNGECVEVKYCEKESKMVRDAVDQAERNCLTGYRAIAITGKKDPIVHIKLKTYLEWYG